MPFQYGGGGGGNTSAGVLAVHTYNPGADAAIATTSTTINNWDSTNTNFTFSAPTSGNVLVQVTMVVAPDNSANAYPTFLYLVSHNTTTQVTGSNQLAFQIVSGGGGSTHRLMYTMTFYVTGLSGAQSWDLGYKVSNGASNGSLHYGGGAAGYGPLTIVVLSA